jgi:hypothetical protein
VGRASTFIDEDILDEYYKFMAGRKFILSLVLIQKILSQYETRVAKSSFLIIHYTKTDIFTISCCQQVSDGIFHFIARSAYGHFSCQKEAPYFTSSSRSTSLSKT